MNSKFKRHGFTLVEMLIVIAIFGALALVGTNILLDAMRNANRAALESEVRQNASKVMQNIGATVRSGNSWSWTVNTSSHDVELKITNESLSAEGNTTAYRFRCSDGAVLLEATPADRQLTSATVVALKNCGSSGVCGGANCALGVSFGSFPADQPPTTGSLPLTLTFQQRPDLTRADFNVIVTLTDSFLPRSY